jgi:antitoxin CptB
VPKKTKRPNLKPVKRFLVSKSYREKYRRHVLEVDTMLNAEIMQDAEQRRLAWRCRRGMLELDIVLQRFIKEQFGGLTLAEMEVFDEMLELPDGDFWAMIQSVGRVKHEAALEGVLQKLSLASAQKQQEEA